MSAGNDLHSWRCALPGGGGLWQIKRGTVYLPRLLGAGAALPLIITGQRIRASHALKIGLVWETAEGRTALGAVTA